MTPRLPDWGLRLGAWLASISSAPFAYGSHDCALFAAGAIEAMTGVDHAADWRGRYKTQIGGFRVLRRAGFGDHIALARSLCPPIRTPRPGDLAIIDTPLGRALGVVQGAHIYAPAEVGWGLVPRSAAIEFLEV